MKDARSNRQEGAFNIVGLLRACAKQKDLARGSQLHEYIRKHNSLQKDCYVASTLVSMYARCGALAKAQQVLHELPVRDGVTWTALISAYAQQGQGEEALKCFDSMQQEGHLPNAVTFSCALKACGSIRAVARGKKIHDKIASLGFLGKDVVLGNTLVDMYVKFGALDKAQHLLNELPVRDVVTWNAVISGYAQQGQGEEALRCFDNMQREGHSPNAHTFTSVVKACGSIRAAAKGEKIYKKVVNLGMLEKDVMLGSTLVDMYARCGALAKAQQVLRELPVRNVVTWNSLLAAYAQHGQGKEALECFDRMQQEGHLPDVISFTCALKACGSIGAVAKGGKIHDKIVSLGMLEKDLVLASSLVDMYAKCGALSKAQKVIDDLSNRDVTMWTALITGYTQQGQGEEALKCFDRMQQEGHIPNAVTFTCALKAYGTIRALAKGEIIHDKIVRLGLLEKDIALGSAVVDIYARCGALNKARQVLYELPLQSVVAWNALITGYVEHGQGEEALKCFDNMQRGGHSPNAVTFICVLKACGSIAALAKGAKIHDKVVSLNMLEKDIVIGNTLIDMYAKCGALKEAQEVLNDLPVQDVVAWNTLITGYVHHGQGQEALKCFNRMKCEGHSPNIVTFTCVLKACGSIGATTKGEEIHDRIVSLSLLEKDMMLGCALVDMYARVGALLKAQEVFDELCVRDVASWNALISGYIQQDQGEEALGLFDCMQCEGLFPDAVTFTCALKACGLLGVAAKGEVIHDKIVSLGLLEKDIVLGNTLLDMHAKCAALTKVLEVLKELPIHNVVTWNALIGGYAQQGKSGEALDHFERMQFKGVMPDSTTFNCVLTACSHSGLLDESEMLFLRMSIMYDITPDIKHYGCMIDLFSRAGKLNGALLVIEQLPYTDSLPVWLALLSACRIWRDPHIGRLAFKHAHDLDKSETAAYVCMANIYTAAGMQVDADGTEVMGMANGAWEFPDVGD